MATEIVQSNGPSNRRGGRERGVVLAAAAGIVSVIAVYLAVRAGRVDDEKALLPYQSLAASLPEPDQLMFRTLREGLLTTEGDRARSGAWPEPGQLARRQVAPFAGPVGGMAYEWSRLQHGAIVNYFGRPLDASHPAWLLEIQEPEPGMPPDPAPLGEEHHQLPDGTRIHTYVWTHRFGGQVAVGFTRQPQSSGWVEVFSRPPDPAFYNRR